MRVLPPRLPNAGPAAPFPELCAAMARWIGMVEGRDVRTMEGVVTVVQESRFQLTDDRGASHLFILGHDSAAEPDQLAPLGRKQSRVRVRYSAPRNVIGLVAHSVAKV